MPKRIVTIAALTLLLVATLAVPAQAGHNRRTLRATLTTGAEIHEVVGSDAVGRFRIVETKSGFAFRMGIRGLSGPAGAAHIHGPATAAENAGILVTLCGGPLPGAVAECTTSDAGNLRVRGHITHALLAEWGITSGELGAYMRDGLTYVNVHTGLNPAGEVRGQIGGSGK